MPTGCNCWGVQSRSVVAQGSGLSELDAAAVAVFRNAHLPPCAGLPSASHPARTHALRRARISLACASLCWMASAFDSDIATVKFCVVPVVTAYR